MGIIMLAGYVTIGFFIVPIGITLCAIIGLFYGFKKKDKLFGRCSFCIPTNRDCSCIYTICLIGSM